MQVLGVVLAGGRSRRMGRPKPFLPGPDGRPLLDVAFAALRSAGVDALAIAAHDPAPFADRGLPVVRDRAPDLGPLAGIEAALRAAPTLCAPDPEPWCLLVACDMPRLDPALLAELLVRAKASSRAAVVPRAAGRVEPLHAAWHPRALPAVSRALDEGRLAVHELLAGLDVEWVDVAAGSSFDNVNEPADVDWR